MKTLLGIALAALLSSPASAGAPKAENSHGAELPDEGMRNCAGISNKEDQLLCVENLLSEVESDIKKIDHRINKLNSKLKIERQKLKPDIAPGKESHGTQKPKIPISLSSMSSCTIHTDTPGVSIKEDDFCWARGLALEILDNALAGSRPEIADKLRELGQASLIPPPEAVGLLTAVSHKLQGADFYYGDKYGTCGPYDYAYAQFDTNDIILCNQFKRSLGPLAMAQVLIHEGAHLAGVRDECAATNIELGAMRRGWVDGYSRRPLLLNGYLKSGLCSPNPI